MSSTPVQRAKRWLFANGGEAQTGSYARYLGVQSGIAVSALVWAFLLFDTPFGATPGAPEPSVVAVLGWTVLWPFACLWPRRRAMAALVIAVVAATIVGAFPIPLVAGAAIVTAGRLYAAAVESPGRRDTIIDVVAASGGLLLLVQATHLLGRGGALAGGAHVSDAAHIYEAVFLQTTFAARSRLLRVWRARVERADAHAASVAAAERLRIARELHDIVGHRLSGVVVQAQAGRTVLAADPALAGEALTDIERESRAALDELRVLLGALRSDEVAAAAVEEPTGREPQPTFDHDALRALLAISDGTGSSSTSLQHQGELAAVQGTTAVQALRIVQEALANARRHAAGATRSVRVTVGADAVVLEIENDAGGRSSGVGAGVGLVGMRERAALVGGSVDAGPHEGGWRVRAELPLTAR